MHSIHIAPEAKAAILERFAHLDLCEPGLLIYQQPSAANVVRSPNGQTRWNVQHNKGHLVKFTEMPLEVEKSERFVEADGIRVIFGPMNVRNPNSTFELILQDGKICVENVFEEA